MKRALALTALLLLSACGGTGAMHGGYPAYLAKKGVNVPVTEKEFPHCHGYGCRKLVVTALPKKDWQAIDKHFKSVKSAEKERTAIARAIAQFEKSVGRITGTDGDKGGTYVEIADRQHDCVDESLNTTIYLALLEQRGKLKFHSVSTPTARSLFSGAGLGPHQTAVITETETGESFAVDSWFHDNGTAPEIVPLRTWNGGWRPAAGDPHSPSSKTPK